MSTWQLGETFAGDVTYESPVLTFGGGVRIYLNPEDAEGAAITLRVEADFRNAASVHLTMEEAGELAEWLKRAVDDIEEAA